LNAQRCYFIQCSMFFRRQIETKPLTPQFMVC
jgi:hypothetical protein